MSTTVSIPTANYVHKLSPDKCPSIKDFDQQTKLWRFYCTCLDLGCPNYKLEDYLGKDSTEHSRYNDWVTDWQKHYNDVSNLIRAYKRARSSTWFYAPEQANYRAQLVQTQEYLYEPDLYNRHQLRVRTAIEKLKRSAQHLLNARYTAKLASQACVMRKRSKKSVDMLEAA